MPEQRVGFDEDGVTTWVVREYTFCAVCFTRACEDGQAVCNGCSTTEPRQ